MVYVERLRQWLSLWLPRADMSPRVVRKRVLRHMQWSPFVSGLMAGAIMPIFMYGLMRLFGDVEGFLIPNIERVALVSGLIVTNMLILIGGYFVRRHVPDYGMKISIFIPGNPSDDEGSPGL